MDCCTHTRGLNRFFDERNARAEVRDYWKHGIDKHARNVAAALAACRVEGASVLEVGGGIGGLHAELLARGAVRATDVDISEAYIAAAQSVAERLGIRERVEYRQADFAGAAAEIPAADVVVLHRVVCCYPDMPALVAAAAQHADHLLALSFPHHAWYTQLFQRVLNATMWLQRAGFRFYVHKPEAIYGVAAEAGLRPVRQILSWPWQIVVFERSSR
jgi:magnesium-protoporphyrin O-methyltransferase